ncbi:MAG TPA: response regulator transcription factor [Chitinophagaceae bacterium]|jgi:DNA-binding NarL/FixJ family response regulator
MQESNISVAIADDHKLLRNGLANHIRSLDGYSVIFEADHGRDFVEKLVSKGVPDIALLDINMPVMDGYDTSMFMKNNYPDVKILALSMYDNEEAIIRMLKSGAKGYILKDIEPVEFRNALDSVAKKGFYYSELVTNKLVHAINSLDEPDQKIRNLLTLTDREIEFIKLACTEMTYKEIADKMFLSVRTIDGYRDDLFEKLNFKTRVGLVLYAIKNGIVTI